VILMCLVKSEVRWLTFFVKFEIKTNIEMTTVCLANYSDHRASFFPRELVHFRALSLVHRLNQLLFELTDILKYLFANGVVERRVKLVIEVQVNVFKIYFRKFMRTVVEFKFDRILFTRL